MICGNGLFINKVYRLKYNTIEVIRPCEKWSFPVFIMHSNKLVNFISFPNPE